MRRRGRGWTHPLLDQRERQYPRRVAHPFAAGAESAARPRATSGRSSATYAEIDGFVAAAALSLSNGAATNADLQALCTASSSDCAAADAGTGQCDFSAFDAGACTATVSQLSACLNDVGAMEDQAAARFPSCSSLTAQNVTAALAQDAGTSSQPASCVAFDNACPGQTVTGSMGAKM